MIQNDKDGCSKYIYYIIHILFGLDFGVGHSMPRSKKYSLKLYSFTLVLVFNIYIFILNPVTKVIRGIEIIKFSVILLALIFTPKKYSVYYFRDVLKSVDSKLNMGSSLHSIDLQMAFFCFCAVLNKIVHHIAHFIIFNKHLAGPETYIDTCVDVIFVVFSFVYYSLYRRLKMLKVLSKSKLEMSADPTTVPYLQSIYKATSDALSDVHRGSNYVYSILLLLRMFKFISVFHYFITRDRIAFTESTFLIGISVYLIFLSFFLPFAPAVCAGAMARAATEIKILLHDRLLQETDEACGEALEQLISYVEALPMRVTAMNMHPLDATLVSRVLDFAVTALIFLLQWTHLY